MFRRTPRDAFGRPIGPAPKPVRPRPPEYTDEEWRLFLAVMDDDDDPPPRRALWQTRPTGADVLAAVLLAGACLAVIGLRMLTQSF